MSAKVTIQGMPKLLKRLDGLEKKVANKIVRSALRTAAKPMHAAARANAPRDTGQLAKSIKLRAGKRRKGRLSVRIGTREGDFKGDQFYAAFNEYGTSKQPARPFLRPAFDANKEAFLKQVANEIAAGIKAA